MSTRLNTELIRSRRLGLGLSERRFAALTGLGQAVVRGIESGIPTRTSPSANWIGWRRHCPSRSPRCSRRRPRNSSQAEPSTGPLTEAEFVSHCVAMVGALLFDVGRLVPVESLAPTVDLSLDETRLVLNELDGLFAVDGAAGASSGQQREVWRASDAVPHESLQRSWRSQLARRALDAGQARLLHQTLNGRRAKALTNDQQVTAAELVNAGLLKRTGSGGVELSDDVRYWSSCSTTPRRLGQPGRLLGE